MRTLTIKSAGIEEIERADGGKPGSYGVWVHLEGSDGETYMVSYDLSYGKPLEMVEEAISIFRCMQGGYVSDDEGTSGKDS